MCRKTTRAIKAFFADPVRKVFPACVPRSGGSGKKVFIKIFDEKNQLNLIPDLTAAGIKQVLELFFNGLGATPDLPQEFRQFLQTFFFEVIYEPRTSTQVERQAFGTMDFPVYLTSTEPPAGMTANEAEELFESHKIPSVTTMMRFILEGGVEKPVPAVADLYQGLRDAIDTIKGEKVFGISGVGNYFIGNSPSLCRKITIIKVGRIVAETDSSILRRMFVAVIKHEIGHMFGLDHEAKTIMHGDSTSPFILDNETYTVLQLKIMSMVLKDLSEN